MITTPEALGGPHEAIGASSRTVSGGDGAGGSASSLAERLAKPSVPSLAERLYETLRQEIVSGTLPPGTRLSEPALATELSASRTPVREALQRLEQDGLVEKGQGGGLQVVALTRRDAAEIMGIRAVLEGYAAELAAERITAAELDELRDAHRRAAAAIEAGDLTQLVQANTTFHDGITAASHSPRCTAMVAALRDWVLRYRPGALADDDARRRSFAQHAKIIEALERGDAEQSATLVREHVLSSMRAVVEAIAE